jgi:3-oxoadipate enol-lactonase
MTSLSATSPDGLRISYVVDGAATACGTIVFQHGVGFSKDAWAAWLPPLLGAGFRTIRIDLRGHGASSVPPPGVRWTTDALVKDVMAVLDKEGLQRCHYVGESWGGTIGLALAARHRDRIASLSVMSTTYDGSKVANLEKFPPMIAASGMAAWSEFMLEARFMPDVSPDIRKWAHETQISCEPQVISDVFRYAMTETIESLLPDVQVPVLILAPQGSPFVKPEMALALRDRLADAELLRFPGHRHGLVLTGAQAGSAALLNFLQRRFQAICNQS